MWLPKFLRGLWLPTNNKAYVLVRLAAFAEVGEVCMNAKKLFTLLDLCVSSLRRGHANLLCIVPILTDDSRRRSMWIAGLLPYWCFFTANLTTPNKGHNQLRKKSASAGNRTRVTSMATTYSTTKPLMLLFSNKDNQTTLNQDSTS